MQRGFTPMIVIAIVVALLILGGAGWYLFMRAGSPTAAETMTAEQNAMQPKKVTADSPATPETMASVIERGENLQCDWRLPVENAQNPFNSGKLYTTSSMGRSHIAGNVSGISMESNAIYRDGSVYSWTIIGGTKTGFTMNPAQLKDANASMTAEQKQQAEQIRSQMIFDCQPWTPDAAQFTVPTDVTFRSM